MREKLQEREQKVIELEQLCKRNDTEIEQLKHHNNDQNILVSAKEEEISRLQQELKNIKELVSLMLLFFNCRSGRWQAPAAVLPPEGWQRGRGPEGPEDKGHGHSRARRAREWPKHASPRARRARGRAKLSARLGACQFYYMFFTTQPKIAKFMGRFQDLNVGQKS